VRTPAGEEWNDGPVVPAREAASVILLRDGAQGPEVLLVQRNPEARFMGGAWVFPGGSVGVEDVDHAQTALRELREEAGLELDGSALIPFSRWITPAEVKVRFDTHFFVAEAPPDDDPTPDGAECVAARWIRPVDALSAGASGELMLVFPTIKHLEQLEQFPSTSAAIAAARGREVVPVQPRIVVRDGTPHVLLPGDAGFAGEPD